MNYRRKQYREILQKGDKSLKKQLLLKLNIIVAITTYCISNYIKLIIIPKQSQTFAISCWNILNGYVILPLFWLTIGIFLSICINKFTSEKKMIKISKKLMCLGIIILILYSLLSIMVLFTNFTQQSIIMFNISIWITRHVTIFLIPGILLGSGMV